MISIVGAQSACDMNHACSRQPVITHKFDVNRKELVPLRKLSISCPHHPRQRAGTLLSCLCFLVGFCPMNKCRSCRLSPTALGWTGFLCGTRDGGCLGIIRGREKLNLKLACSLSGAVFVAKTNNFVTVTSLSFSM